MLLARHMNRPQIQKWLVRGMIPVVVFAAAVSMHMERIRGWGFLVLCLLVGSMGGFGYILVKRRVATVWAGLPKKQKAALVGGVIAVALLVSVVQNHGRPDASYNNFMTVVGITLALLLWGLYWLFSRFIDAVRPRSHR